MGSSAVMRLLMRGRWCRSSQRGGVHSGSRLVLMRQVQPPVVKLWWWYLHKRVRLSRSVSPPSTQATMWCLGPFGAAVAGREGASLVSGDQGEGLLGGRDPAGAAQGEDGT